MTDPTPSFAEGSSSRPAAVREQLYPASVQPVKDIPEAERPRELFERLGAQQTSDRHLIAIVLRSGVRGRNVVDIADGLLREYGSLHALAQVSVEDLAAVKGMGRVRAQVLKAALELGSRSATARNWETMSVRTPIEAVAALRGFHPTVSTSEVESFWVLLLDTRHRLRRPPLEITRGILDASLVHPREVFKEAVRSNSAALILMHNHPSGDPTPSAEDVRVTRQLVEAGRVVDIDVLDHVVVGRPAPGCREFVSLRESGLAAFSV